MHKQCDKIIASGEHHNDFLCSMTCRLTGSFVPDLIVSMSHQMWLHLQSDESVGSIGFKINYKGTQTDRISDCLYLCLGLSPSGKP